MKNKLNIGVIIIATNKYIDFVNPLVNSINKNFLTNHGVVIYLFTNDKKYERNADNVVVIYIEHEAFPLITLKRYNIIYNHKEILKNNDYLFYIDADTLVVNKIGDEILGDLVATLHPGYLGTVGTPERRAISEAYIPEGSKNQYFCGAFNGGKKDTYLNMCLLISQRVNRDLNNNVIAIWWDESHWNKFLYMFYQPDKILPPSYAFTFDFNLPEELECKILLLSKNHKEYQV